MKRRCISREYVPIVPDFVFGEKLVKLNGTDGCGRTVTVLAYAQGEAPKGLQRRHILAADVICADGAIPFNEGDWEEGVLLGLGWNENMVRYSLAGCFMMDKGDLYLWHQAFRND